LRAVLDDPTSYEIVSFDDASTAPPGYRNALKVAA
jgi:hypothetical protein